MNRVAVLGVCACVAAGMLGAVRAVAAADEPALRFRGAGSTRAALDAMQLKPFDQSLWSNLTNWRGTEPKGEEMTGKVVLIVTWANWYKVSHAAMKTAQSLGEQYAGRGLVVVGVHNPVKPEGAAEKAAELGITFPIAEDKSGKFRAGVKADQDPNVYLIDRAGNLRYAQVSTSSMPEAVAHLVAETVEEAIDYPKGLERRRLAQDAAKWRTRDAGGIRPGFEAPTVSFVEPDEEAYARTKWPYMVGKIETDTILEKIKNDPPKIQNWPEEDWVPRAPNKSGKILVVYFVDPKEVEMLNVIPAMNRLHDKYHRDAVVVCSLFKFGAGGLGNAGNNNNNSGTEGEDKVKTRNKDLIPSIVRTRNPNHYINPSVLQAENFDVNNGNLNFLWSGSREEFGIAILMSTDMKMRWFGNSHDPLLTVALDKLIAADPGVQARRKAEAAQLRR
ncbi:MAG TPA: TlpA disulfide reductase family protein [Phycisphaerales bacterium]|nr:TlpA disulfide reductase family protein [Phycisphaerales bacterium]